MRHTPERHTDAADRTVKDVKVVFNNATNTEGIAAALHVYSRMKEHFRYFDELYTQLWWGGILERLAEHFIFEIHDFAVEQDITLTQSTRIIMKKIDKTEDEELNELIVSLDPTRISGDYTKMEK